MERNELTYSSIDLYKRALLQAKPYWIHLLIILLLGLLATPIALVLPMPLKLAVDSVVGSYPLPPMLERMFSVEVTSKSTILALAVCLLLAVTIVNLAQRF